MIKKLDLYRNIPISIYPPIMFYNKDDVNTFLQPSGPQDIYANLYIHIPFCPKKCDFCYFTSFSAMRSTMEEYVDTLCREIEFISSQLVVKNKIIHSIYFGGGTPTFLPAECLKLLFTAIKTNFEFTDDVEICMEVRPGKEATSEKLELMKEAGVNRISVGIQSFNDSILKSNGRNSNVKDGLGLLDRLDRLGFGNINIDVMSGMLNETEQTWQATIDRLLDLQPQNITVYKMQLYENSNITKYCKETGIQPMNEEIELEFVKKFYSALLGDNYHLMSSTYSFSKDIKFIHKYREYRNSGEELIALGLSSNGCLNGHVYQKTYDLEKYIKGTFLPTSAYKMTQSDILLRGIILGLKSGKVDRKRFLDRFKTDPYEYFKAEFENLENLKYVEVTPNEIVVLPDLIFYIDDLLRRFFMPQRVKELEKLMLKYKNYDFRRISR